MGSEENAGKAVSEEMTQYAISSTGEYPLSVFGAL